MDSINHISSDPTSSPEQGAGLLQSLNLAAASIEQSSAHDLPTLLKMIAKQSTRLLGASGAAVSFCSPERQEIRIAACYQTCRDFTGSVLKYGEGSAGWVAQTGEPLVVVPRRDGAGALAVLETEQPFHSLLSVPMVWRGQVNGVIQVFHTHKSRRFTETDRELLILFANIAEVVIENTRLFEAERAQLVLAQTLQEVGALLTSQLGLGEVLENILDLLARVVQYDSVSVQLIEPNGSLNLAAGRGFPDFERACRIVNELSAHMLQNHWKGQTVHVIPDTHADSNWIVSPDSEYIHAWVGAPLMVKERFIGSLNVDSRTPHIYNAATGATVMAFANQAAIAIENARLFEAERAARERAEALHDAARVIGSTLSLNQVLGAVLDQIERVVPYDTGHVMLIQSGRAYIRAWRGFAAFTDPKLLDEISFEIASDPTIGQVVRSGEPVSIPDTRQDLRWRVTEPGRHVRSWLGIPLKVREQVIGLLSLDRTIPGRFSEDEVRIAQAFTLHASAAIENARLFEAEGKRAAELEALRQVSLCLTASLELYQVLDAILAGALNLLPEAYNSHIFLYNPEKDRLTFGAALWADGTHDVAWSEPRPQGLTYTVARSGEPIVVPDMRAHPLYANTPEDWNGAIIGLPLKIGQRVLGVMNVSYKQPRKFSDAELRLLGLLGDQAAIAIENARLFEHAEIESRHLRLLYDVGRELAASLDPDEILNKAISLTCQALHGLVGQAFLYQSKEGRLTLRALFGRPAALIEEVNSRILLRPGVGLAGWVLQHKQLAYVPDVEQDQRWVHVKGIDDDVHAALIAPILTGDRLLGVLSVLHPQPGVFSTSHFDLIQAICQEVGLALSNASRYQQIRRRLTEITLIQNLAQTFNQRLEVQVLLDEVVSQIARNFDYPRVQIFFVKGDGPVLVACYGSPPSEDHVSNQAGIISWVSRSGQVAFVPGVMIDSDHPPSGRESLSELAVPIFRGEEVFGVINIECERTSQLTNQDRDILQLLAGQISVALENAELYEHVRLHAENLEQTVSQRTSELTELYELSQEIGYQLSYEEIMHLLLRHLGSAVRSELVAGCLAANGYHSLSVGTSRPIQPDVLGELRARWSEALHSVALHSVEEASALSEQIEVKFIDGIGFSKGSEPITQIAELIQAPILIDQKQVGLLIAGNEKKGTFGTEHERLLGTFANQAAVAVQRLSALLTAQQKNLESLVEHMPVGTLLFDTDFNLLVANPIGREIMSLLNQREGGSSASRLGPYTLQDLVLHQDDPLPVEITLKGPTQRFFHAQIQPVGDPGRGEKQQWVLTVREVTQERESQARIQSQERLATVGQLAAGIAHDFNNIMAAILVYADLLHHDPGLTPTSRDKLGIIQQQVHRAASLIRQILDFSRRSVMDQSALDLLPFIKELDKLLGRVLPETIRLELNYKPVSYWVSADPTRLQQVFLNLALNARDAMPEGGILRFDLNRLRVAKGESPPFPNMPPGEWVRITITDTGVGISAEVVQHIFEPFFTTKPVGQGTGLGLAQVYGIIKQHDGFIDVQSREGEGTSFIIYLPALPNPLEEAENHEISLLAPGIGGTVLVVEDDQATREALRALLEAQNYVVLTASNGVEALQQYELAESSVVLIVSDIVMPQMGGMALYQALQECQPGVKMLFVTGHPLEDESQALLEKGSVHWLQKPFSVKEFNREVNLLLKRVK